MKGNGNPQTRSRLLAALSRARRVSESDGQRLTVCAVAREASVSHTLIFKNYPDIVEMTRRFAGATRQGVDTEVSQKQKKLEARLNELRASVANLEDTKSALLRRNYELERHIDALRERMQGAGSKDDLSLQKRPNIAEILKGLAEVGEEQTEGSAESTLDTVEQRLKKLRASESILRRKNRTIASRNATLELLIDRTERYMGNIAAGAIPMKPLTL